MLVPLTQLFRVIKVYFPLALPGPKGINVEVTVRRLTSSQLSHYLINDLTKQRKNELLP
jgi:hypothetical protein